MNARLIAALLPCAAMYFVTNGHAASGMQAGMWEITTRMEMPGMPVGIPPQTIRHCYTQKDVEDGKGFAQMPKPSKPTALPKASLPKS